ncbi:hypothetical protein M5I08_04985 [Candidatus Mycobacterium methanotrophicum]|uniref:Uncharacterized protein n=1 Tax=Candidatus Mycobacterium methanotrophicum TaxID=2943498 RepID=A0ABY4QQ92_9MYCO|nr:hypothetical protein [Candidatus Mycobacterium methanotrophicum]UQX11785.1 hypothetical protein M5I08_04985 [Candidatus Mycobacterium methanotrophicum]
MWSHFFGRRPTFQGDFDQSHITETACERELFDTVPMQIASSHIAVRAPWQDDERFDVVCTFKAFDHVGRRRKDRFTAAERRNSERGTFCRHVGATAAEHHRHDSRLDVR